MLAKDTDIITVEVAFVNIDFFFSFLDSVLQICVDYYLKIYYEYASSRRQDIRACVRSACLLLQSRRVAVPCTLLR